MEALKLNGIVKKYGNKEVLSQTSMLVHEGDIYGLIGENGAGKTTLIRIICGLIKHNAGEFCFFEDKEFDHSRLRAIVEAPSLYLNLNAYDNLLIQSLSLGLKNHEDEIKRVLTNVGLISLYKSKKKVRDFSLGMRQRLGIAVCLLGNPRIIILDEPLNGLDPEGIKGVRELILYLNKEMGITFIISSHLLSELSKVASRYGFLRHGRIIKEISSEELAKVSLKNTVIKFKGDLPEGYSSLGKIEGNKIIVPEESSFIDELIALRASGVIVTECNTISSSIEDYYLNMMRGERDE